MVELIVANGGYVFIPSRSSWYFPILAMSSGFVFRPGYLASLDRLSPRSIY
jgi:hypothetical protein